MNAIIMPEVIIYKTLSTILKNIKKDLETNVAEPEKTVLYALLGKDEDGNDLKMNRYNMFEQASSIFKKKDGIKINYGFNLEIASENINIHIILPSEEGENMNIGGDEGYYQEHDGILKYVQVFNSTYQMLITSTNQSEAMLVYHTLKSLLLMIFPHFELSGLMLPRFSGSDVMLNQEYVPPHLFSKALNLSFKYELIVPQTLVATIITGLDFSAKDVIDYNP